MSPKIDNVNGIGAVPNNSNIDYLGWTVHIRPSIFLRLALPLPHEDSKVDSTMYIIDQLRAGAAIAAPFLIIKIPEAWNDGDFSESAKVVGHEGRHRALACQVLYKNTPIEVHIMPRDYRARHMTVDWKKSISKGLYKQGSNFLVKDIFSR